MEQNPWISCFLIYENILSLCCCFPSHSTLLHLRGNFKKKIIQAKQELFNKLPLGGAMWFKGLLLNIYIALCIYKVVYNYFYK